MKVEIWSDVVCPFCYIGKRRFEEALNAFEHKDQVEVEWKSFQLNPGLIPTKDQSLNQYLSEAKGISLEEAEKMNQYVCDMAKEVGLEYHLENAIVANTFNAHKLLQYAKSIHLGDEMKEALMKAYFVDAKDLNSIDTLIEIANSIGIDVIASRQAIESHTFDAKVEEDAYDAQQIGVRGVPFFVFDRKFGISGAQPLEVFERTLKQTLEEKA
jgi:predicted DsbA family dithiol-disulfide isomerase